MSKLKQLPYGKPLLAVADGYVVDARWREVGTEFPTCGADKQAEIYIKHQIGIGEYAERFVTYYAHASEILVQKGQLVKRGQLIGKVGSTGCSDRDHLHFSVTRLTNLSGSRFQDFWTTPNGAGVNSFAGIIDPFGWNAPQHIDPLAWRFLNRPDSPGAFSLNLWISNQKPPSSW